MLKKMTVVAVASWSVNERRPIVRYRIKSEYDNAMTCHSTEDEQVVARYRAYLVDSLGWKRTVETCGVTYTRP